MVLATLDKLDVVPIVGPIITGRSAEPSPIPGQQSATEAFYQYYDGGGGNYDIWRNRG